ncbi:hypothetical protein IC229_33685 [Spirosoma sp. BT702]|uniref:Uncharacterized protein n=1 Tax=Spirosoma profusum TaxID=2771354 RepID=A0A927GAX6_9BACT|nr:hypothetical protein [Spirosoma profusum]MBD2705609.1 hypothetical protein [Spirosoma profusum]
MAKYEFIKGHTLFSYFAGDVVDAGDVGGAENAKKLVDGGFLKPYSKDDAKETPEDKIKTHDLEIRTGAEANSLIGQSQPDTGEGQVIADVSDRERLGLDEKPVVVPKEDKLTAKNVQGKV